MTNESKEIDELESNLVFIRTQFIKEFKRIMENDVSKTLMINMVEMSKLFTSNLGDLTTEWKLFTQVRMPVILEKYGELSFAD